MAEVRLFFLTNVFRDAIVDARALTQDFQKGQSSET